MAEFSEAERAAIVDRVAELLAEGKSLRSIGKLAGMPNAATIWRWMRGDSEISARLMDAREIGFANYAEETLELVQKCRDPHKARVVFDARRWYLGKLSNAFAEKPVAIGALVNVDAGDTAAALAGALDRAAAAIAGRSERTRVVVVEGEAGPGDAAGRLADLAGSSRAGLGEDSGGC